MVVSDKPQLAAGAGGVKVTFDRQLHAETRAEIVRAFKRLKAVKLIKAPLFRLVVTEKREPVLEALGSSRGANTNFPFALRSAKARRAWARVQCVRGPYCVPSSYR